MTPRNGAIPVFDAHREIIDERTHKYSIAMTGAPLAYSDALVRLRDDTGFRSRFLLLLAGCGFAAYRWETPPIATQTAGRPFEFVLHDAPELSCAPDRRTFARHFAGDDDRDGIVVFDNLGADATLVVPCPPGPETDYSHFAAFVRNAPETQQHALLQTMAQALSARLAAHPLWMSTAGDGVAWLHVRLDSRPKYYKYRPYRSAG